MKKKVLLTTLALALMIQSSVMAEATHKHIWEDDIKNSNEIINRYTCECGATKDVELELVEKAPEAITPDPSVPSTENKSDGGFSVVSMLIGIVVGAVIGAGVMLVVGKKKR